MLALGNAIRILRSQKRMSQKDLADRAEITPSFLSLVESDRRSPSLKVIERIAAGLDIPSEVLVWESLELPKKLSERDRRMFQTAKIIARRVYENAARASNNISTT
jgi:transcriptional regulator with XRE-family HTH domain